MPLSRYTLIATPETVSHPHIVQYLATAIFPSVHFPLAAAFRFSPLFLCRRVFDRPPVAEHGSVQEDPHPRAESHGGCQDGHI